MKEGKECVGRFWVYHWKIETLLSSGFITHWEHFIKLASHWVCNKSKFGLISHAFIFGLNWPRRNCDGLQPTLQHVSQIPVKRNRELSLATAFLNDEMIHSYVLFVIFGIFFLFQLITSRLLCRQNGRKNLKEFIRNIRRGVSQAVTKSPEMCASDENPSLCTQFRCTHVNCKINSSERS